jgi:hypothetical protein
VTQNHTGGATHLRLRCPQCAELTDTPIATTRMFVCREQRLYNTLAFTCERCGDVLGPLSLDRFYLLQTETGIPVTYFTMEQVQTEQLAILRAFSDGLDSTLDRILDGAA